MPHAFIEFPQRLRFPTDIPGDIDSRIEWDQFETLWKFITLKFSSEIINPLKNVYVAWFDI